MLISVVNLGRDNYLGSPDYFYTYRPGDPFFRGLGDPGQCLFGQAHGRTAFGPQTEPSSRLPNLLDGGIRISNIREHQGTLTFDLALERAKISGREYTESMLPQIRLDRVTDIQPASCTMDCTIMFRGEPLKTDYGFCWSTSRNPTIRDPSYNLCHRGALRDPVAGRGGGVSLPSGARAQAAALRRGADGRFGQVRHRDPGLSRQPQVAVEHDTVRRGLR